jgi:hypothetical protein
MKKKRITKKRVARPKPKPRDYVVVSNRGYGNTLKGTRIYFEGRKPKPLREDGGIKLGKHILETLTRKFPKFRWIITLNTDSIQTERGIVRVRTSQTLLKKMSQEEWDRGRDIKNDIVRRFFAVVFPKEFTDAVPPAYVPGTLSKVLNTGIITRLSSEDKDAVTNFIPEFAASESVGTVDLLRASAQIHTLKDLARDLETEIGREHAESWWQAYIKSNILLIQQGYIKALDKINVAVGNTKFPDFSLITHDNYLDILEIKRPNTSLLKFDKSRGNYFWDGEIAKAIIQVENYIENVGTHRNDIRSYVLDKYKIDVKAIRPRGIVLVGDTRTFEDAKLKADFRLLREGIKNVTILTYDELFTRLNNYITVLEEFGSSIRKRPRP